MEDGKMQVRISKIDEAANVILDGGVSGCVVTVYGRYGEEIELNYQEWRRVCEQVARRGQFTDAAAWEEPTWYGVEVEEIY